MIWKYLKYWRALTAFLASWFSYRRKTRDRPVMGDRRVSALLDIQPDHWQADYTRELIDLLNVVGLLADLEPAQAELLAAIGEGPVVSTEDLGEAGVLPVPQQSRTVPKTWPDHADAPPRRQRSPVRGTAELLRCAPR